jgi:hypothetical protein
LRQNVPVENHARRKFSNLVVAIGRARRVAAPKVELTSILDLSMNIRPPPDGVDFDMATTLDAQTTSRDGVVAFVRSGTRDLVVAQLDE